MHCAVPTCHNMANSEINRELCRICLDVGANISIFEKYDQSGETIEHKFFNYINQKIEDLEGYPRNICIKCNTTVDLISVFIKKFQDTNKILQQGLKHIKQETKTFSDNEYCDENVKEVPLYNFKAETNAKHLNRKVERRYLKDNFSALFNKKEIVIRKIKVEPENAKKKKRTPKVQTKVKTEKILKTERTGSKSSVKPSIITNKQQPKKVENKTEPLICEVCGKSSISKKSFNNHMLLHEAPTNATCTKCGKTYENSKRLRRHMLSIHRQKKFMCAVCGIEFCINNQLTAHYQRVHQKHLYPPKLYQCSFCSKSYKSKAGAIIHEKSAHTGERPEVCTVCDARFFHRAYLKEHMRLHTGETPFKCPVCSRGYAQRGNMKSHMKHNHRLSQLTEEQLKTIKPFLLKVLKP